MQVKIYASLLPSKTCQKYAQNTLGTKAILSRGGRGKMFNRGLMNKLMKIEWVSEWVSEWSPFESLRNLMNDYVIHELKRRWVNLDFPLPCIKLLKDSKWQLPWDLLQKSTDKMEQSIFCVNLLIISLQNTGNGISKVLNFKLSWGGMLPDHPWCLCLQRLFVQDCLI